MRKLFTAIKKNDIDLVCEIIEKKPKLVNSTSKMPPKKDDGQSPLQVAIKNGNFIIADFLISKGADVHFMEVQSVNEWRAPVIHDAIRATIFNTRYPVVYGERKTKKDFESAYSILDKIIKNGADLKAQDSYGNNCINRACLDAKQFNWTADEALLKDLEEDLGEVFLLLINHGADVHESTATRSSAIHSYKNHRISKFLK